jgi:hypothetical protein
MKVHFAKHLFLYFFGYSNLNQVCIGRNLAISLRIFLVEFWLLKISPKKHLILMAVFIFNIKYFKFWLLRASQKKLAD